MKTDYDKFCWVLGEMGCNYTKHINQDGKSIEINQDHLLTYGGVGVEFDTNGKFKGFERYE